MPEGQLRCPGSWLAPLAKDGRGEGAKNVTNEQESSRPVRLQRVFLVVLDSVGCGALPDAHLFGDEGTDTLGHTAQAVGGLNLPCLGALGLGNIHPILGVEPAAAPLASWGVMHEASAAKDTTTGHWEMTGLLSPVPFATYPEGFPPEIMEAWLAATGLPGFLGNRPASGTQILDELGPRHLETGWPIVYTSADSVFQIAAHERIIPLERLYELCRAARRILDPYRVARVIARPFLGDGPGQFARTYNRHDFSMEPPAPTLLDRLHQAGREVVGVGKIDDVFSGRGLTRSVRTHGNADGLTRLLELAGSVTGPALVFANLIDFDMLYGHRRNPAGYARALEEADPGLAQLVERLGPQDLLLLTADHGCDPTFTGSTDHTREQVPLLAYRPEHPGVPLGQRDTFADVGQTIAEALGIGLLSAGSSFLSQLDKVGT